MRKERRKVLTPRSSPPFETQGRHGPPSSPRPCDSSCLGWQRSLPAQPCQECLLESPPRQPVVPSFGSYQPWSAHSLRQTEETPQWNELFGTPRGQRHGHERVFRGGTTHLLVHKLESECRFTDTSIPDHDDLVQRYLSLLHHREDLSHLEKLGRTPNQLTLLRLSKLGDLDLGCRRYGPQPFSGISSGWGIRGYRLLEAGSILCEPATRHPRKPWQSDAPL